jgi:Domain of unknown function (DUF4349)
VSCIRIAKNGRPWTAVVLLLAVLALPACSRGGEEAQGGKGAVTGNAAEEPASQPVTGVGATDKAISRGVPAGASGEDRPGLQLPQNDFGRKIVETANLDITSDDVRGEADKAQQVAARFGGTIVSSQTYRAENAVYADLVLSVPSDRFEDALDGLRGLGEEVTTDTVSGQDVTEEYVDLQSRERNLLAAEQSLLDLYNRAGDVQDALSIQRELTTVRGQIEQVQGRMHYLKQSSDMSRISLSIRPVASPPKPPPAWDPALVVARAWTASLAVLRALAAAILSTLVFGWWIIPPIALGAWWLRRRRPAFAPPTPEAEGGES